MLEGKKMLDTHADTDFIEDLWMDDCKCETEHKNLPCTVKVTGVATATCCNWSILLAGSLFRMWTTCDGLLDNPPDLGYPVSNEATPTEGENSCQSDFL